MILFFYFCKWLLILLMMAKVPVSVLPLFVGGLSLCHIEYFYFGGKSFREIKGLLKEGSRKVEIYLLLLIVSVSMVLFVRGCLLEAREREWRSPCCLHFDCEGGNTEDACRNYREMLRDSVDVDMPFFVGEGIGCCGRGCCGCACKDRELKITKFEDLKAAKSEAKGEGIPARSEITVKIPENPDIPEFKVPVEAFAFSGDEAPEFKGTMGENGVVVADRLIVGDQGESFSEIAAKENAKKKECQKPMKKSEESCKQKEKRTKR